MLCTSKSYPKASVLVWTLFPLLLLDNNCHCKSGRGNGQRGVCVCEQSRSKLSMDPQLVSREETLSLHNPPSPPKLTMALLLKLNLPMGDTASSNKPAFAARDKQFWSWLLKSEHTLHTGVISFSWITQFSSTYHVHLNLLFQLMSLKLMNHPNHQWIKTTSWKGNAAVTSCKEMIWLFHYYGKWIIRESGSGDFNDKFGSDQLNLKSKNENQLLRKKKHQIEDSLNGFPVKR